MSGLNGDFHIVDDGSAHNARVAYPGLQDPIGEALFGGNRNHIMSKEMYEQSMAQQQRAIYEQNQQAYATAKDAALEQQRAFEEWKKTQLADIKKIPVKLDIELEISVRVNYG